MTAATVAMAAPSGVGTALGWAPAVLALGGVGGKVLGVAVHGHVHVHADRAALLLGYLAEQPRGPGEQGEPAQQRGREAQVGEGGTAGPRTVQRQGAAEDLGMHSA